MLLVAHPVKEFLNDLNPSLRAKVDRHLDLLKNNPTRLRMPFSKKIRTDLFELRILGNTNVRIFYSYYLDNTILLHAFIKKTHKLPGKELKLALRRLKALTLK